MLKKYKYILLVITILFLIILLNCKFINKQNTPLNYNIEIINDIKNITNIDNLKNKDKDKDIVGTLIIDKIKLKESLYNINSPKNNVNEHVTILKESIMPDQNNSIMFLAAHSGIGKIAFFEKLDKLQKNDIITLIYKDKTFKYKVKNIYEQQKNGYIDINKEKLNQLILTTCSPKKKDKQLIVNCTEIESTK